MKKVIVALAFMFLLPNTAHAIWYDGKWFDGVEEYRQYKQYHDPVRQRSHLHPQQRRKYERRFNRWYRTKYRYRPARQFHRSYYRSQR